NLWMKTIYEGRAIWHTAFPPLDGGGSSQARVFHRYLTGKYPNRVFPTCFEWCCGPGFLGFSTLWSGLCEKLVLADINRAIVPGVERTIKENGLEGQVRYFISDNLREIPSEEKFDLVLGNPPWAFREIPDLPNPLIPNDPNWRIHREFFKQLPEFLNDGARICVSAYEPFRKLAYIQQQKEPWDIRPRPPILDFREFLGESSFSIEEIHRAPYDPQVAYCEGMSLLLIQRGEEEVPCLPDLIGLGGRKEEQPNETFQFDLTVTQGLPLAQMVQHAVQVDALRTGISQTLVEQHLTRVLRDVFGHRRNTTPSALRTLQLSPEFAAAFPDWNNPDDFRYQPPAEGLRLVAESCQETVKVLRLQLGQDAPVGIGLRTLQVLLAELPESLSFCVLVKPGFEEARTRSFLKGLSGYSDSRVTFFQHGHQTLFAQDNGRLAVLPGGSKVLLTPGGLSSHRPGDALMAAPIPLVQSRLSWEGGNLLCDGHAAFVGANSVAANMRGIGLSKEQVVAAFAAETGYQVHVLGEVAEAFSSLVQGERGRAVPHAVDGGQADFHIDLDCCFLGAVGEGRPRVVVADPEAGLNFLTQAMELEHLFVGHCVGPEKARQLFRRAVEESVARRVPLLDRYCRTLEQAEYEVHRIPDIRLVSDANYLGRVNTTFGYCNALSLKLQRGPTVALLSCGLEVMEAEVARIYNGLGVEVLWLGDRYMAEDLLSMRGGLHCFCSVMG
ncbi:MAG: methyltransferase, partial [Candidatus Eremiobacteraeota bacterium]|nr:methyltransferase [Candidatus Eremiobacteraeota bacterium]